MENVLKMVGISKEFSEVTVVDHVDFAVNKGEIRALLGANGAGKSTLMKILAGIYTKTTGKIYLEEQELTHLNPSKARDLGIAMIHQELSAISCLTVVENFFLGRELKQRGILREKKMLEEYQSVSEEFGIFIDPDCKMRELSIGKQQMLEIMKTVHSNAKILIMDEPTTSLSEEEKQSLFQIIRRLQQRGTAIIYISHLLEEVFALADTATIMRNGMVVGTYATKELTIPILTSKMSGEEYQESIPRISYCRKEETPVLKCENVSTQSITDISFEVRPGEVVGLAGLVGAGRTEVTRAIFGLDKLVSGKVYENGMEMKRINPRRAIGQGFSLLPEDRKKEGLIIKHELYKNSTLVQLQAMKKRGLLNFRKEKNYTENAIRELSIQGGTIATKVEKLSGGNQQKVVLSKWISKESKLFIFDEPTKGIDISAKEEIFKRMEEMTKKGSAILFISSDLKEVLRVSDTILVMKEGQIIETLENKNLVEQDILRIILDHTFQNGDKGNIE